MTTQTMSKIKIKRSTSADAPSGLEFGELAYSTAETAGGAGTQTNNGERLFFKYNGAGAAAVIGGKYFTDMLDHVHGTLTADSAIVTDSANKIDVINVGNITITGSTNTISSTDAGGDIKLDTDTTGVVWVNDYYLPNNRGSGTTNNGFVLTMEDASIGKTSWKAPSTTLELTADTVDGGAPAGNIKIDLLNEVLNIAGDATQGLDTKINKTSTDNTVTITARDATSSQRGVAKFDTSGFVVNTTSDKGNVTLKGDVAQSFAGDTGTATPSTNSFSIIGDSSATGIVTTASGSQVKISANYASASQYGVAKFSASYWSLSTPTADGVIGIKSATNSELGLSYFPAAQFQVSSGSVSIKNATLDNAETPVRGVSLYSNANFTIDSDVVGTKAIKLGITDLALGSTVTTVEGMVQINVGDFKIATNKLEILDNVNSPDLILLPFIPTGAGTAGQVKIANSWVLPNTAGSSAGYVLTSNGSNGSTWQPVASTLNYKVDAGTNNAFDILNGVLSVIGDGVINVDSAGAGLDKTITISVDKASTSVLGVASFKDVSFDVSAGGEVTIKAGGVTNTQLVNSKVTVGTTDISLGSSSTVLDGLTDVTIGKIQIKDFGTGTTNGRITTTVGNLELNAYGSVKIQGAYTLPSTAGSGSTAQTLSYSLSGGQALVTDGAGGSNWQDIPYVLELADDDGNFVIDLLNDTLTIKGHADQGVSVVGTGTIFEISVANATDTTVGVARFKSGDFTVGVANAGEVQLADTVVQSVSSDSGTVTPSSNSFTIAGFSGATTAANAISTSGSGSTLTITARLASDTVTGVASFDATNFTVDANGAVTSDKFTIGSTDFNLGQAATTVIAGLTDVTIGNIQVHDTNKIEYVTSDAEINTGDIILKPYTKVGYTLGAGTVDVSGARITSVASPVDGGDAVNKSYADALVSGLDVKNSVRALARGSNISLSGTQTIDSVILQVGNRVLVTGQTDATTNGIYVVASGAWARSEDANTSVDVNSGMFVFVEEGNLWANSGFILISPEPITLGSTNLVFTQFSAAGQSIAGAGLTKTGDTIDVVVADAGGIEIVADKLQLKDTLAGDGLTYADGILTIGGTADHITVSANAITIADTYAGQSSIVTLGTITAGTWHGATIAEGYGGTGQTTYAKGDLLYASDTNTLSKLTAGASYKFLMQGADGLPVWSDLDGGTY